MFKLSRSLLLLSFILLASYCKPTPKDIPGFDETLFRADQMGCQGERAQMREIITQIDTALKGMSQKQIQATLGKPDRHELAPRSQKYFVYYIDPAPECPNGAENPFTMLIRFSALDRSTEVSFQNY
ncbi:hypothetical protein [Tunicatimonas pelagia]|uniref:hypothetical protein n=1 Tax=Tunicatimonas pelagia TaxID=931531 RepID=UPI002665D4A6|nr:hypothetical protein [Tunicatimonas pelagia]WKN44614.1 hypothetical protein P0M28_06510 [Tunicatimonas pelagia]